MVRLPLPGNKAHSSRRRRGGDVTASALRRRSDGRAGPRLAAAGVLLLVLGGCSFLGFAWQWAGGAIVGRVDYWLDLDERQEERLARRLEPWLEGMQRTRLPAAAAALDGFADRTAAGFGTADVEWASDRFWALYRETLDDVVAWLAPTLASLDARQRRHLARRMKRSNADYRAEYVDVSERERKRALAERIIEQVERWTGPLEPAQHELIHERARHLPDTAPAWYEYRLRMQAGLLAELARDAPPESIAAHLRAWWIEFEPRRPADVAGTRALRAGIRALLVDVAVTLEADQQATTVRRIRSLGADLTALARNGMAAEQ